MPENDPEIVYSNRCRHFVVDGHRFEIKVFCTDQDPDWCLEVVDSLGTSHVWDIQFDSDEEAMAAALHALEEEGAESFLNPNPNVIPFPSRRN